MFHVQFVMWPSVINVVFCLGLSQICCSQGNKKDNSCSLQSTQKHIRSILCKYKQNNLLAPC